MRGSRLATKTGIIVLAVLLLVSAYFQVRSLIILLAGLLMISVIACLWTYFSLSKIELIAKTPAAEGFPGEELTLKASITNRKILPILWLNISMPQSPSSLPVSADGDGALCSFVWIMPHQTITWDITLTAVKRGYLRLECLRVSGGDGFGLSETEKNLFFQVPADVIVFPKLINVDVSPLQRCLQELEVVPVGAYEDTTLIKYARSYMHGDSARRINWRQAARTGELEVNIYERQAMCHATLAIDIEAFIYIEEIKEEGDVRSEKRLREEEFERMISLCASAAMELARRNVCCTMILPDGRVSAANPSQGRDILRALAMLDPLKENAALPGEEDKEFRHRDGPVFLFTDVFDSRIETWLEEWRSLSARVIVTGGGSSEDPAVIRLESETV